MKITICASEASPYAKSGGLGDVMEALPRALARMPGNEVTLILPYYNKIKTNTAYEVEKVAQFRVQMGWRQQFAGLMKLVTAPGGVTVYFIDNDYYFGGRTGAKGLSIQLQPRRWKGPHRGGPRRAGGCPSGKWR